MIAVIKFLRFAVVVALTGALATLISLAHASPPDPVWIGGVYDDDDHDLVVVRIIGTAGSVEPFPLDAARSVQSTVTILHRTTERPLSSDAPSIIHARAPPVL